MTNVQPVAFIIMVLWLGLLFSTIGIAASDFFCVNLSTIANLLGMSESLAGVTFLAFGNGSPDVFSTFAAMSTNSGSLAVGELIGAAGFITAVVAGSMAIVRPFKVAKKSFVRDVGFFIVAAAFSMVFLYDGKLYWWECVIMVGFYLFYVCFVVSWHWWLTRRRRRRQTDAAIRSHYVVPGGEEAEVEAYHDEDEGDASNRPQISRGPTIDDFSNLERGGDGPSDPALDEDEEEEVRERFLGELNSNMRLSRPRAGERRNTHTPIRPSLVGALEFRAVLSSLKKSRNVHSTPINLRRYSDDPNFTAAQQREGGSPVPNSALVQQHGTQLLDPSSHLDPNWSSSNRLRAVSVNAIDGLSPDPTILRQGAASSWLDDPVEEADSNRTLIVPEQRGGLSNGSMAIPPSPAITVTPPVSGRSSRAPSIAVIAPHADQSLPSETSQTAIQSSHRHQSSYSSLGSPALSPHSTSPHSRPFPKLAIPAVKRSAGSPTLSPFPTFQDQPVSPTHSLRLPPAVVPPDAIYHPEYFFDDREGDSKPLRWWPYRLLPPPGVLVSTLFPTLYTWKEKNIWEKVLGIIAAPSVFLLTITLPVVESGSDNNSRDNTIPELSLPASISPLPKTPNHSKRTGVTIRESGNPSFRSGYFEPYRDEPNGAQALPNGSSSTSTFHRNMHHAQPVLLSPTHPHILQSPETIAVDSSASLSNSAEKGWNRWLVILQSFTAPIFIVLIYWANTTPESPRALLRPALIALLISLIILLLLLATTTPERPPKWRFLLSFAGFVVAISWISTIANEVVGVLKTLGVILNMSDAILGLTIFAVGNSLGDLVADITVARLGYPVMALSACFGGPMLNILLGIGLSGLYITIKGAQKRSHRHPEKPMKFKPYHIDVSRTLMVSGAVLLLTLLALLVMVPMRKWKMDRYIGWGLVALWVTSTAGNVVGEVLGWGGKDL